MFYKCGIDWAASYQMFSVILHIYHVEKLRCAVEIVVLYLILRHCYTERKWGFTHSAHLRSEWAARDPPYRMVWTCQVQTVKLPE